MLAVLILSSALSKSRRRRARFPRFRSTMLLRFRGIPLILLPIFLYSASYIAADPQINLISIGCSNQNSTNPSIFLTNLNATIHDIKSKIYASGGGNLSAVADRANSAIPVYSLAFCRGYLSRDDCLTCITSAAARARTCGAGIGGLVIYDGCTLMYDSAPLFDQSALPVNNLVCVNGTGVTAGYATAERGLLLVLSLATPRISRYFIAAAREGVYAAAQCSPMVSEIVCLQCLQGAYENMKRCLLSSDGRAVDARCFMRYSKEAFFSANYTMDLAAYLRAGGLNLEKKAIIGGLVGGVSALIVLVFAVVVWIRRLRRPERRVRGDILEEAELKGPVNFHYNDLKSATSNFSREGGFGEVYKGTQKNGKIIAVKKLAVTQSKRAAASFLSEVKLISNGQHQNLLRFLGCSTKNGEMLLEYMANGSLDKFLFGEISTGNRDSI